MEAEGRFFGPSLVRNRIEHRWSVVLTPDSDCHVLNTCFVLGVHGEGFCFDVVRFECIRVRILIVDRIGPLAISRDRESAITPAQADRLGDAFAKVSIRDLDLTSCRVEGCAVLGHVTRAVA